MFTYDLLIPSHGGIEPIQQLLLSLKNQTMLPARLVVLVWKERTVAELHDFAEIVHTIIDPLGIDFVLLHSSYTDHESGRGVGYDRHFLVQHAIYDHMMMIDEDNVLPLNTTLEERIHGYQEVSSKLRKECIVSPTIMRAGKIQSQGITGFRYRFPKYTFGKCTDQPLHSVKMIGANSLLGPTKLFQSVQFDPRFVGSYEDIDFSTRVNQSGYHVVVLRDVQIDHCEPYKTRIQEMFLGNPSSAYSRSRNRILRVRKTATVRQKIQYFGLGLRIQTGGWFLFLLSYPVKGKRLIGKAIMRGIRDGLSGKG